jgi:hypothetical protein
MTYIPSCFSASTLGFSGSSSETSIASSAADTELESGGQEATEAVLMLAAGLILLGGLGWSQLDVKETRVSERARDLDLVKTGGSTHTWGAPGLLLCLPDPLATSERSCQENGGRDVLGPGNEKLFGWNHHSEEKNGRLTFQIRGIISAEMP